MSIIDRRYRKARKQARRLLREAENSPWQLGRHYYLQVRLVSGDDERDEGLLGDLSLSQLGTLARHDCDAVVGEWYRRGYRQGQEDAASGTIRQGGAGADARPRAWGAKVWRTGRRVGRTIYVMNGPNASYEDRLIGVMDTPGLAVEAVSAHNDRLRARERDEDPREVREAFEQGPHGVTRES